MAYIGNTLQTAQPNYQIIDDISASFDGSTTTFALQVGGATPVPFPISAQHCMISVGGVIQQPDPTGTDGFLLSGSNIVFSAAPASGEDFFGVVLAGADYITVGATFPDGSVATPSITFDQDTDTGLYRKGANNIAITTNGTERVSVGAAEVVFSDGVTIDSSGRLLAGTSSASSDARLVVQGRSTDSTAQGSLYIQRGSTGSAAGGPGSGIGEILFCGSDASQFASIKCDTDAATGASDYPGRLIISTTADGASSPSERMRFESNGNIGVNATSAGTTQFYVNGALSNTIGVYSQLIGRTGAGGNAVSGYNAPASGATGTHYGVTGQYVAISGVPGGGVVGILASVYGILGYYDTSSSWAGYFNGSTYATGTYQGSDARLKDVVEPVSGGILDKLASIQPVKYRWKENTDQRETVGDGVHIGLIAQEVEEHFPELVKEIKHSCPIDTEQLEEGQFDTSCSLNHELGTFKTLEYQHLTAVLVEALKEAKTRIEILEAQNASFETRLTALETN